MQKAYFYGGRGVLEKFLFFILFPPPSLIPLSPLLLLIYCRLPLRTVSLKVWGISLHTLAARTWGMVHGSTWSANPGLSACKAYALNTTLWSHTLEKSKIAITIIYMF